jgi:hypothetical protein
LWYDPVVGVFVHKTKRGAKLGGFAGNQLKNKYMATTIDGKKYLCHRLAWLYMTGEWPKGHVDHKNGNRRDNSFNNLRDVDRSEQMFNTRLRKSNRNGYKGVTFHKLRGTYNAAIQYRGVRYHCGVHVTPELAAEAYDEMARELFGEFAKLNFPREGEAGC